MAIKSIYSELYKVLANFLLETPFNILATYISFPLYIYIYIYR